MDILEKIISAKRIEVKERQALYPAKLLEQSKFCQTPVVSLKKYIMRPDKQGIIAEFKRQSPSKGMINQYADVEKVTVGYMQAGASALSVLTDTPFFGGKNTDLTTARRFNYCPILRKDFIVDEYQIIEARSIGADAILLIAETLSKQDVKRLATFAKSLGLEILMEVHSADQLDKAVPEIDLIGVNNRNLKTFEVSIQQSVEVFPHIPNNFVKISESGLSKPEDVVTLKQLGFNGFLIGENFMKTAQPDKACNKFIREIKELQKKTTNV